MEIKPVYAFPGHSAAVKAVLALPDGKIASIGFDTTLRVFDRTTWRQAASLPLSTTPFGMCMLSDGRIAVGCGDHSVHVIRVTLAADGVRLTKGSTLSGHEGAVFAVVAFRNAEGDEMLATGSRDKTIRLWDVAKGICTMVLAGQLTDNCTDLAPLTPNLLASACADGNVRVHDIVSVLLCRRSRRSALTLVSDIALLNLLNAHDPSVAGPIHCS